MPQTVVDNSSPRQIVCVASTMRSGSTLLKALLAEADDVSNLPEQDFQKFQGPDALEKAFALDDRPIIVLKRPGWYNEIRRYPRLPDFGMENPPLKTIVLVRDAYETVESLRKMTFRGLANFVKRFADPWLAQNYWRGTNAALLAIHQSEDVDSHLVRYEDLTRQPLEETRKLFQFIGSSRSRGTDTYQPPANFKWKWGSDDNSDNIKSLQVQSRPPKPKTNTRLVSLIENDSKIVGLRKLLGYIEA